MYWPPAQAPKDKWASGRPPISRQRTKRLGSMAEALGIASSIIAVVDLSAKVLSLCLQYSQEVKRAKDDIERLGKEVADFQVTTEEVKALIEGRRGRELKTSQRLASAIEDACSILEKLTQELQPSTGRKAMRRFGVRALRWPFESKDIEGTIQNLADCRENVLLALNIDQTAILQNVDHKIALDTLPIAEGASFDSHAEEHNPICMPNTREELLSEIDTWIDDPKSKTIFWLNGMAGTGKSTISRTVARSRSKQGDLGASFFFKRGETDRGKLAKFVPTVARRLAWSTPGVAMFIKSAVDADQALVDKAVREQFEKLLREPLSKATATSLSRPSVVIVVDALDECEKDADIKLLLELFSTLSFAGPLRVRVLITSRPELPVRLGFSSIDGIHQDLILHKIPQSIIEHDISVFLRHEFANIRNIFNEEAVEELKLPVDWPGEVNLEKLTRAAVPLFIFAATICRFVNDSCLGSPDKLLQSVLHHTSNGHASKLDMTYSPVLKQQVVNRSGRERRNIIESFRLIVGTIITLASPLSVRALALLLDVHIDEVTTRLRMLHSVLEVPESLDSPVRLLHLSFRDYLVDPENTETVEFWVDEKLAHRKLAKHCLHVMRGALRKNICSLPFPDMHRSAVGVRQIQKRIPPELQYACMNWVHHQTQVDFESNGINDIYDFLKTHFLHWLEALSLIGRISESIGFINELQSIVDPEKGAQVLSFLRDAKRFVLNYRWIIDTAPLQLYASAIVFAPKQSIMRQTFQHYLPRWISLLPNADSDWSAVLQTLEGHTSLVMSVVFSNDGKLIASGSYDKTVKIWDVATGEEERTLEGHTRWVTSVVFSNDGKLIASGSYDKTVKIWDVATGEEERTLEGHTNLVTSVVFSNDGKLIASGSYDKTVKIWDVATGEEKLTLEGHTRWVTSVVFSNDGKLIASGSHDRLVKIWDVATGEEKLTLEGHTSSVSSVVFSNNGKLIASGSHDALVKIWDVATGEEERTLEGHTNLVTSVVFSNNGKLIASGSYDELVKIWDVATGEEERTLEGHTHWVYSVAFSKDGKLIASGSHDRLVKIWDVATGEEERTLEGHTNLVTSVAFSKDGKLIASGSYDRLVKIWDVATGEEKLTLEGHTSSVSSVVFSKDGKLIASGSHDKTVKIWNVATGEDELTLEGHIHSVNSVAFLNDGKLIASGSHDRTVKIWDIATGEEERTLEGHIHSVYSVAFSNDGKLIASGSDDKTVKIWKVATGEEEQTLKGHTVSVRSVVFSNDGKLIASGSYDRLVKIWDVATGINVKSFDASRIINVLSFTDDDSVLVTSVGRFSLGFRDISTSHSSESEPDLGSTEVQEEVDARLGFGINYDNTWITAGGPDGRKVLWLPPDFRASSSATLTQPSSSVLVIGCPSGRVVIMGFGESSFSEEV
ncbi:Vegetative incompatibility protein [Fusarium oxysporum f. sp. matthiolae]|nr:Vegetative incompatibility protein [Fusarium oxysporum f. sp. matthiolae]